MTVFDTIRFPNPDIYNEEDMSKLPRDLLQKWAEEGNFDMIRISKQHNSAIFATVAKILVLTQVRNHTRYSRYETSDIIEKIYKKNQTDRLKKLIAEYDSDNWT